jgi:hypothetical protein
MTNDEAIEVIEVIADSDYGSTEPDDCKPADVRSWLENAKRPGYTWVEDVPGAIARLGMDRAVEIYIARIKHNHVCEYECEDD